MQKVPVIVLSGFLGSGKTTLLLRLLQEAKMLRLRCALLMNELGKHDVDGRIVEESMADIAVEKLLDGCICCSKKSEVSGSIQQLLTQRPDVIFIELTGVANPEEVADALTEPQLLNRVSLHRVITVIDAEYVLDYNSIFSADKQLTYTLRRQMESGDWLIINKSDLVKASVLDKIEKAVRKQNPSSPIFRAVQCEIDLTPLFEHLKPLEPNIRISSFKVLSHTQKPTENRDKHHHEHSHHHHNEELSYSRVQTVTLAVPPSARIDRKQLEKLLNRWNDKLLRAKGYLNLSGNSSSYLMQYAGKRITWQPSSYEAEPYLVFIGMDMDFEQLRKDAALIF